MNLLRRARRWFNDRTGLEDLAKSQALHLVPPGSKWWYVFGSATLIAFVVQIVSGIALATVFTPSAGEAYNSLEFITKQAPLGRLVRGIHYFGASAMVLFLGVHMIRVYLMASFKYPREVNWLTGVLLLGLTVMMGFTGQMMRWDQNAVWSAVVGAEQAARTPVIGKWLVRLFLSGGTIGTATLSHFFALHVFVLPGLLAGVLGLHLYLVLRNGISEPPVAGRPVDPEDYRQQYHEMLQRSGLPFWPYAAWRDVTFGFLMVVGIVALALFWGSPDLSRPPDPAIVQSEPRPDWYLLWYFAVLAMLPHHAENYVIILAPLVGGLVLFAVPFLSNRGERSWRRRPWAPAIVVFVVTCIGVLTLAGERANWSPDFTATPLPEDIIGVASGPVHAGGVVFNTKGCLFCHTLSGHGGKRGPDLTEIGNRLTPDQMIIRILNGGYNMPAYANDVTPEQLNDVVAFLESRR